MEGQFYGILTLQRVAVLLNEPAEVEIRARNEEDRDEVLWRDGYPEELDSNSRLPNINDGFCEARRWK